VNPSARRRLELSVPALRDRRGGGGNQPVSVAKVVGVGLIIAGVLTLNLAGAH
jgi:hypothetical protein